MHTGIFGSNFAPPIKVPFWKLTGYTFFPNFCSRSLFHAMLFRLTFSFLLSRENVNVSLNILQAINPQGTIGRPLDDSSGSQELVWLYSSPCKSCWSLLLFTYLQKNHQLPNDGLSHHQIWKVKSISDLAILPAMVLIVVIELVVDKNGSFHILLYLQMCIQKLKILKV